MRDATRIKELAQAALDMKINQHGPSVRDRVVANLEEIVRIADQMDARTGTKDPSWWQKLLGR